MNTNIKFCSLKTTANNIGEEIQILAASRFYPHIDQYLNKERLNMYKLDSIHKIIINGWFMRNGNRFYLTDKNIIPLLISIHISPSVVKKFFNNRKNIEFLKNNAPIGCRDTYTLVKMRKFNIDAYYSGCLTLTLQKNINIPKMDYILLIDCPKEVEEHVRKISNREVLSIHPVLNFFNTFEERMQIAILYLKKIQQANMVISTRLHGVLPSLALDTKAIFIMQDENTSKERCSDIKNLLPCYSVKDFIDKYSLNKDFECLQISTEYLSLRKEIIDKCTAFTSFNNENSLIPDTNDNQDIELLFSMMKNSEYKKRKILFDISPFLLIKNLFMRVIMRKNDDDIY